MKKIIGIMFVLFFVSCFMCTVAMGSTDGDIEKIINTITKAAEQFTPDGKVTLVEELGLQKTIKISFVQSDLKSAAKKLIPVSNKKFYLLLNTNKGKTPLYWAITNKEGLGAFALPAGHYNRIIGVTDAQGPYGYWPINITRSANRIEVNISQNKILVRI
ncbi:MAG: hypothetical protein NT099_07450 [Candidatus Saganbacteria bacterium]|nr:hypothetical protein [Candidatus Saganbacteria bacterium]